MFSNTSNFGGGVNSSGGAITITRSTIKENKVKYNGAGILIWGGQARLLDSLVSANRSSGNGGGIYSSKQLSVTNSTIYSNTAVTDGGGIYNSYYSSLDLLFSSVAGNTAAAGGGLMVDTNSILTRARSSLLAGNTATTSPDCSGTLTLEGKNVVQNPDGCSLAGSGTNLAVDPEIGPLGNYGGPTGSLPVRWGSPAVDAAADCLDYQSQSVSADQRGQPRPVGPGCDLGAFEAAPALEIHKNVAPAVVKRGWPFTYTLSFGNSGDYPADSVITDTLSTYLVVTGVYSQGAAIQRIVQAPPLVWQAGLAPDQYAIITLTGHTAADSPPGFLDNMALITTTIPWLNAQDITSSARLEVRSLFFLPLGFNH